MIVCSLFGGDVSSFFSVQIAFRFFICRDFSLDFLVENSHLKDFLVEISLHIVLGYPTPIPLENQVGWPLYKTTFLYSYGSVENQRPNLFLLEHYDRAGL